MGAIPKLGAGVRWDLERRTPRRAAPSTAWTRRSSSARSTTGAHGVCPDLHRDGAISTIPSLRGCSTILLDHLCRAYSGFEHADATWVVRRGRLAEGAGETLSGCCVRAPMEHRSDSLSAALADDCNE